MRAPQALILAIGLAGALNALAGPYATDVVRSQGPFGPSPYNDTNSVLGAPATWFYDPFGGAATNRRVKLVEAAYNISPDTNGITRKLILTLGGGSRVIVRFDHPVVDNPVNPYGIDFLVFGNTFYPSLGFADDNANLNTLQLTGGAFFEPLKVSVSPGYTGQVGEDPADPDTWPWYRYESGPYCDTEFPTQAYKWNRSGTNWTDELMDFTKPVNPTMHARIAAGGLSAADAIDLYTGSGGGTGFDLRDSGFASIQYVKVEGIDPDFSNGEIDAFACVRPMSLGDTLSITPDNIPSNTAAMFFQKPGADTENVVKLTFASVSDIARVITASLDDLSSFASLPGPVLAGVQLNLEPILGVNPVMFETDLGITIGMNYSGDGHDLLVLQSSGTNWSDRAFAYNSTNHQASLVGLTNLSAFVVVKLTAPPMQLTVSSGSCSIRFTPIPGFVHTLERSTNLLSWLTIDSFIAGNALPVVINDTNAPPVKAFYRLRLDKPL